MNQITVKVDGQEKLVANFNKIAGDARSRVKRTMQLLGFGLVGKIQREYLSGQRLNRRTGRLSGSIHEETDDNGGAIITTVGTNVEYARPHEYGFSGSVAVKAHLREIKQAFGRPIAPKSVHVRGFSRKVDITEKRFMRDALADYKPVIEARLTKLAQSIAQDATK